MGTGQDQILGTDTVRDALKTKVNDDIAELFDKIGSVCVSSNDTTEGYLNGKLDVDDGLTLTENNDGGDETLTLGLGDTSAFSYGNRALMTEEGSSLLPLIFEEWSDVFQGKTIVSAEYWDGSSWVDWSSKIDDLQNLLDGRKDSYVELSETYKKFRITINAGAYLLMGVIMVSSWTRPLTLTVETSADQASWTTRGTASYSTVQAHILPVNLNDANEVYWRLTFDFDFSGETIAVYMVRGFSAALHTGVFRGMPLYWDWEGNVGIKDSTPSYALDVTGDIHCTGKLTSDGGNDPPYVLYDYQTRKDIVAKVKKEIPPEKLSGAVMFFNGETQAMELFLPLKGEFRSLSGELLDTANPITTTFETESKFCFDEETGEVKQYKVKKTKAKYKIKPGVELDPLTGKFRKVGTSKEVPHSHAIEKIS